MGEARRHDAHPDADLFPLMTEERLATLTADIVANGLLDDIWLSSDELVLDGRNRLKACEAAGVEPRFRTYDGDDTLAFVLSKNNRRDLDKFQRAWIAAKVANRKPGRPSRETVSIDTVSLEAAAARFSTPEIAVKRCAAIQKGVSELSSLVELRLVAVGPAYILVTKLTRGEQKKYALAGPDAVKAKARDLRDQAKRERDEAHAAADRRNFGTQDGTGDGDDDTAAEPEKPPVPLDQLEVLDHWPQPGKAPIPRRPEHDAETAERVVRQLKKVRAIASVILDGPNGGRAAQILAAAGPDWGPCDERIDAKLFGGAGVVVSKVYTSALLDAIVMQFVRLRGELLRPKAGGS